MQRFVVALASLFMSVALLAAGNAFVMTLLGVRLGQQKVEPLLFCRFHTTTDRRSRENRKAVHPANLTNRETGSLHV